MRVGLIGVGAMGSGFARNLLDAGYDVVGCDRQPQRLDALVARGGTAAATPAEASRGATWVVTSLPGPDDVRAVVLGPGGIVEGAAPGTTIVDTSTSLPEHSRRLAAALDERDLGFVDASISGTGATVMTKDIVMLVGGSDTEVARCDELFRAICRRYHHLGPTGSGALAKLVVNVAVVGNRLALAEALTFGISAGMDAGAVLEVLKDGSSYSRAMDLKGEKMIRRDYEPESTLGASVKGASTLLDHGREIGAPMFLTGLYAQIAQVAVRLGYESADPASVIEALRHMGREDQGA